MTFCHIFAVLAEIQGVVCSIQFVDLGTFTKLGRHFIVIRQWISIIRSEKKFLALFAGSNVEPARPVSFSFPLVALMYEPKLILCSSAQSVKLVVDGKYLIKTKDKGMREMTKKRRRIEDKEQDKF